MKKTSAFCLLEILKNHSDSEHILTQPEICRMMEDNYGVKIDRRTLYSNVEMLQNFGYEISDYKDNSKGYYLMDRTFEPSEVFLLANAVHSSNFVPLKASDELIEKLLSTQSRYVRESFHHMVYVNNDRKKENKQFFYTIELLANAIKEKKTISFSYQRYDINKNMVDRRKEPYILSPYYLVAKEDKVYLVGKSSNHNDFTHFRVDRMKDVKEINAPYIFLSRSEDPYEYAKSKIYMFNGEERSIAIKCDYSILDNVIDTFGKDITIVDNGDSFTAYVKSSLQGMVYFAMQYLEHMEVIEPDDLVNVIKRVISEGIRKYHL